jgi:ribosomal-protein-alanine N-acetyltransferase
LIAAMTVPTIRTERLDLISMSPGFIEALLDGRRDQAAAKLGCALPEDWPDDHDARFLHLRHGDMERNPGNQQWYARAISLRAAREMIGHIGFHGPPADGWAEMGYTVFEPHGRKGYAEESVLGMMRWARKTHGIQTFRLSIDPENEPSLALAAKLGFVKAGERIDPVDGLEHVFELRVD